jgi:hypothetical protein
MASQTTPPYAAYAGIMSAYVGSLAAAGAVAKLCASRSWPGELEQQTA